MADVYAELGEFHDLFMVEPWERLRPYVRELFAGLGAADQLVDIGAGTGMGTRVLAQESPARITCLEPSLLMRSVLTARVADAADLEDRVSVLAGGLPDGLSELPAPVAGGMCTHVLGGVEPSARAALYGWLAINLTESGSLLVTVHEPDRTAADETADIVESRVLGDLEYRAVYVHAGTDAFSTRYEVHRGDRLLRTSTFEGSWTPVSAADLEAEIADLGLTIDRLGPGVAALRRAG